MLPLLTILESLATSAPLELAESWDNVGLLLGDDQMTIEGVMTCLTLTPDVAEEAVQEGAQLIISHHPLLFRPVQKLTNTTIEGQLIVKLLRHGIAVYSPHTAFDNAALGINQLLAERLNLQEIRPLRESTLPELAGLGTGRWGRLHSPCLLGEFLQLVRMRLLNGSRQVASETDSVVLYTGNLDMPVSTVGICCGSGGDLMKDAHLRGCDVFLTGEARFHSCLEARNIGMALVQAGHYATERPGIESLANSLQRIFPTLRVWASAKEQDPLRWKGD